eukprot:TRINITY_DN70357_c0_g2_i1.p1 TRINITY_DN70357_c0_g2~~TRINITY_DN70357_c0_g2_i1.p1  ORF type:complete len:110 (-),score=8.30 TRINITY_DN70357_c0_g2_i1:204-533(-)
MARVKKATPLSTPKSKSKRRKHLAYARQCKAAKESEKSMRIGSQSDSVSVPSTSGSSTCASSTSASVQDSVLGNKTRTQFKHESYEILRCTLVAYWCWMCGGFADRTVY